MSSCISLSPTISKAPIITCSPVKSTEVIKRTALLERIQRKRLSYLKRIRKYSTVQSAEETVPTNDTQNVESTTCNFDMESESLASHIVEKTKTKMRQNLNRKPIKRPSEGALVSKSSPHGEPKRVVECTISGTAGNKRRLTQQTAAECKRTSSLLPFVSPAATAGGVIISEQQFLSPPRSLDYSKRYKEVQRKWHEDMQERHKQPATSTPVVLSPLLKSHRYVRTESNKSSPAYDETSHSVTNRNYTEEGSGSQYGSRPPPAAGHQISINSEICSAVIVGPNHTTSMAPSNTTTKCKRRLTFSDNFKETKKLYTCSSGLGTVYKGNTNATSNQKSPPKTSTLSVMATKTMKDSYNNGFQVQAGRKKTNSTDKSMTAKEVQEAENAVKLKQERQALKLLQRAQIYALNAIMKEFEESNFTKEMMTLCRNQEIDNNT